MMARADTTGDASINVTGAPSGAPVIEFVGVTKRFPGVVANDGVDLAIRPGEVHVLLGENGAGKSTLIGMLSGLQQPDEGAIRVDGRPQRISSPRRALNLGIGTVFQHVMLAPSLSVLDNVALGGPWWRRPDRAGLARRLRDMNASIGVSIDPDAVTGALSLGEQQQAEIVRALLRGSRVLVLDEATAMLTPKGVEELGALMRRLARARPGDRLHHPQAQGGLRFWRPNLDPAARPQGRRDRARTPGGHGQGCANGRGRAPDVRF